MIDEFYEFYLQTNRLIVENLKTHNLSENQCSNISQLILNRVIFLCFCEKYNIIKKNSIKNIENWKEMNDLFEYANENIINFTFLFQKNLKFLDIDDEQIFENFSKFNSYDININSLGILFERNISDFELKRKDGVYYTPDIITEYMCRNTIISYLSLSGKASTTDELINEYNNINILKEKLNKINILDPSCGSGAFLIKSFDVLYEIHKKINSNVDITAIAKSIYGVDLNSQSIEITKIILFLKLKSLMKDFNTNILEKNIKCGNSLIDDKNISKKAFKWKKKFDIILTNPPYVNIYKISSNKKERTYYQENYKSAYKKFDLYVLFLEKGLDILKNNGKLSYIIPDSFTNHPYGFKIREILLNDSKIEKIIDLTKFKLFKGVSNKLIIIFLEKNKYNKNNTIKVETPNSILLNDFDINTIKQNVFRQLNEYSIRLQLTDENLSLITKINEKSIKLGEVCYVTSGTRSIPQSRFHLNEKLNENSKRLIIGKNVYRYHINYTDLWLDYNLDELHNPMFPELFENEKLIFRDISSHSKIMASYDDKHYYTSHTTSCCLLKYQLPDRFSDSEVEYSKKFDLKYILGLVCSKLSEFYFKVLLSSSMHVYINDIRQLPIVLCDEKTQKDLINLVNEILQLNENVYDIINLFYEELKITRISRKLKKYYELDLDTFLKEIKNYNISDTEYLKNIFLKSKNAVNLIFAQIDELDNKLNKAIYELYDLNNNEIELIENFTD